jgi:hypothetical protein
MAASLRADPEVLDGLTRECLLFSTDQRHSDAGSELSAGACSGDDVLCPWMPMGIDENGEPHTVLADGGSPCHGYDAVGGPTCEAVFRTERESNRGLVDEVRLVHGGTVDGGVAVRYRFPFAVPESSIVRIVGYAYHPVQPSVESDGAHVVVMINTDPVWEAALRPGDSHPFRLSLRGPFDAGDAVVIASYHQRDDWPQDSPDPNYDDVRARVGIIVPCFLCAPYSRAHEGSQTDGVTCDEDPKAFTAVVPPIQRKVATKANRVWPVVHGAPAAGSAQQPTTAQGGGSGHAVDGGGRISPSNGHGGAANLIPSSPNTPTLQQGDGAALDPCERTRKTCVKIAEGCAEREAACDTGEVAMETCAKLPTCASLKATCTSMLTKCAAQQDGRAREGWSG